MERKESKVSAIFGDFFCFYNSNMNRTQGTMILLRRSIFLGCSFERLIIRQGGAMGIRIKKDDF